MFKGNSGHFRGATGTSAGNATREEFMGKSIEQISEMLKENGYEFNIRSSKNKGFTKPIMEN